MKIFIRAFLIVFILVGISLIPPMFAANPFAKHSEFVHDCTPEYREMMGGSISQALDLKTPENAFSALGIQAIDISATAMMPVASRIMCSCFEESYGHLDYSTPYQELAMIPPLLMAGNLEEVERIMAPMEDFSESESAGFSQDMAISGEKLEICVSDELTRLSILGLPFGVNVIIAANLGLLK